jgi:hypothetical protein
MTLRMPEASMPRGLCTETPCITSLVFRLPLFMVNTETSCPILTRSRVMYSAYVPRPPTSLGGYSHAKNAILTNKN